jgi:hypothetical protein
MDSQFGKIRDRSVLNALAILILTTGIACQQKLTASDGFQGDGFGSSVSLDGDTAVIGAAYDNDLGSDSGSAYVFVRSGTTWVQQQKLTAGDGAAEDVFGENVSVEGDTAVASARWDDDLGQRSGSAYVFVRSGTTWMQQQKLTASDGSAVDEFGSAVTLDGDTAAVGAHWDDETANQSGSVYVFVRSGTSWTEQQKLTASDGVTDGRFGDSVALDGHTLVVGASGDDDNGFQSGSVYVFVRSGTTWSLQQKLSPGDGAENADFGWSVSLDGDTLVVGALRDNALGDRSGSAYVFVRSGTTWTEQQKLTAADGAALDHFGVSVSVAGETAVVGTVADTDSTYIFVRNGTTWTQRWKLTPSDGAANRGFGTAVSLDAATAFVGAPGDDAPELDSGSAYAIDITLLIPQSVIGTRISDFLSLSRRK